LIKTCAADADAFAEAADAHGSLPYAALAFPLRDFLSLVHLPVQTWPSGSVARNGARWDWICRSGLRLKVSFASGEAADRGEAWHQTGADFYRFDPTGFD